MCRIQILGRCVGYKILGGVEVSRDAVSESISGATSKTWMLVLPAVQNWFSSFLLHVPVQNAREAPASIVAASCNHNWNKY